MRTYQVKDGFFQIHEERCKSCGFCTRTCPRNALTFDGATTNSKGYQVPQFNPAQCTLCGSCYTMCPDCVFELMKGAPA